MSDASYGTQLHGMAAVDRTGPCGARIGRAIETLCGGTAEATLQRAPTRRARG